MFITTSFPIPVCFWYHLVNHLQLCYIMCIYKVFLSLTTWFVCCCFYVYIFERNRPLCTKKRLKSWVQLMKISSKINSTAFIILFSVHCKFNLCFNRKWCLYFSVSLTNNLINVKSLTVRSSVHPIFAV